MMMMMMMMIISEASAVIMVCFPLCIYFIIKHHDLDTIKVFYLPTDAQ
jgi:hypothetical protein